MSWRKQDNHKEETKAVKKALADAGIKAKVTHGRGTAWGWLHINIGSPKERNGIKPEPFDYQYTEEELAFHRKVWQTFLDKYPQFKLDINKEYNIDIKTSHFLLKWGYWGSYNIDYNNIADYFMIIGLGADDNYTPIYFFHT